VGPTVLKMWDDKERRGFVWIAEMSDSEKERRGGGAFNPVYRHLNTSYLIEPSFV